MRALVFLLLLLPATAFPQATEDWDVLPGFHVGMSFEKVRAIVSSLRPRKDWRKSEFETEADYEARIAVPDERQIISIPLPQEGTTNSLLKYDADSKKISLIVGGISCGFLWVDSGESGSHCRVILSKRKLSSRTYVGANSFGVKKLVTSSRFEDVGLIFYPFEGFRISRASFEWDMEPEEARKIKPFLSVAVICRRTQDRLFISSKSSEATISYPYESEDDIYLVPVAAVQFVLYDSRDGRIVERAHNGN